MFALICFSTIIVVVIISSEKRQPLAALKPVSGQGYFLKSAVLLNPDLPQPVIDYIENRENETVSFTLNHADVEKFVELFDNGTGEKYQIKKACDGVLEIEFENGTIMEYEILLEKSIIRGGRENSRDNRNDIKVDHEKLEQFVFEILNRSEN